MFRRLLSVFACIAFSGASIAQTLVSTEPHRRVVVLEEYTGIHCGYCPDGHRLANLLRAKYDNEPVLINIHSGSFATPGAGEPDFRTQFGDSLDRQSQLTGYPAGTVNRRVFSGLATIPALSRNQWDAAAVQLMKMTSPVNVGVHSTYDSTTRQLTVEVELFYTSDAPAPTNRLNVVLLENNVIGVQSDYANGNRTDYRHMHMLRWMLTGQWGEEITTTTKGSLVKRVFTYTVPPAFNALNCDVAAFVAEGKQEIYSGAQVAANGGTTQTISSMQSIGGAVSTVAQAVPATYAATITNESGADERFLVTMKKTMPADWSVQASVNGSPVTAQGVVIAKGTKADLRVIITPGSTSGVGKAEVEVLSTTYPLSPTVRTSFYLMSGVENLLMSHPDGVTYDSVYVRALRSATVPNMGMMDRNVFEIFHTAKSLVGIRNLFYNVSWAFPGITDASMTALKTLMDAGTNVFIAGQDFGWDLASADANANGNPTTKAFFQDYVMADFVADGSTTNNLLTAVAGDVLFKTVPSSKVTSPYGSSNLYPDEIKPRTGAQAIFRYNNSPNKVAGIRAEKGYKMVYLGVGLEQLTPETGDQIVNITRRWFANEISSVQFDDLMSIGASIMPNPAGDELRVVMPSHLHGGSVRVVDAMGRTVVTQSITGGEDSFRLSVAELASGVYRLCIDDASSGSVRSAAFVVAR
ncbi:MAG: Omp28-related outer membrane protein [Candidatus Kapaibacterium sp.]